MEGIYQLVKGRRLVSNPISGEVGAAATGTSASRVPGPPCFKPHQRGGGCCSSLSFSTSSTLAPVSNPISGEVGAAAGSLSRSARTQIRFKPHQRGGGCCSLRNLLPLPRSISRFQTPSAGRWLLQLSRSQPCRTAPFPCFKPHQRGGGCCSGGSPLVDGALHDVSNPISGEVGAAAKKHIRPGSLTVSFQTPSAGRWVLQRRLHSHGYHRVRGVSNPISGEVGAEALVMIIENLALAWFQTPSAGRWVLKLLRRCCSCRMPSACFKPHQRGGGCCSQ